MDDPNGTIRVLIVDDHEMFAEVLASFLEHQTDIEILGIATSAQAAIEHIEETRPDVVLLDGRLADAEGPETTRRIKDACPGARMVMITASPEERLLRAAMEAGCVGFLTKNQAVEEVVRAVRTASEGEPAISPQMITHLVPRLRQRDKVFGGDLTPREIEVLELLAEGCSTKDIAERLVLSIHTVRSHIQNAISKVGASEKLEAVMIALRKGLITIREGKR